MCHSAARFCIVDSYTVRSVLAQNKDYVVMPRHCLGFSFAPVLFAGLLAGCASLPVEPPGQLRSEQLHVLTEDMRLLRVNANHPSRVLSDTALQGLAPGDVLVGIDYRVARGVLYGLSRQGRIYMINTDSGKLMQVASVALPTLQGEQFGFDFNPTVDRMRVVSNRGANLRLHPDSGVQIDGNANVEGLQGDTALHYLPDDVNAGKVPAVMAAAYTYNARNDKLTTMYAIDAREGTLVMQGSKEGVQPFVSPDKGGLRTIGSLGLPGWDVIGLHPGGQGYGAIQRAAFDISDVKNIALLAASQRLGASQLYEVNLESGKATRLGRLAQGQPLAGLAIIP